MNVPFFSTLSPRAQGTACALFAVAVWSGWMVISSYSVRGSLSAYDITALRFGTAGLLLLPVLWKKGLRIGPWGRFGGLWMAATMGATYNTIAIYGMRYAPASHAAGIINTSMLVLTTLGAVVLLRERTTRWRMLGVAVSVAGVALLLGAGGPGDDGQTLGHLFFLAGAGLWAAYALSLRAWQVDPLHATAAVCCFSGLFYMPIYLLFLPSHIGLHNLSEALFQAGYQGVLNSIITLMLFNRAIRLLGAGAASAFLPLIPVIATLLAIPALNQHPGMQEWVGITIAAAGVFLATGMAERLLARRTGLAAA